MTPEKANRAAAEQEQKMRASMGDGEWNRR
jgi:hypothetical protein